MKRTASSIAAVALLAAFAVAGFVQANEPPAADKSGGIFPNDFGLKEIDVSKYPEEAQATYKIFTSKCSTCHTIARPINSQFLELSPEEIEKAKKDHPELFADPKVIQVEDKLWNRYVKRMMSKPGCPVGADGKRIWEFLVYDSKARKTGDNLQQWIQHRKKLLDDFKKEHPAEYAKLFEPAK